MYIRADPNEYCCIPGSCYTSHCSIRIAQAYSSAFVSVSGIMASDCRNVRTRTRGRDGVALLESTRT